MTRPAGRVFRLTLPPPEFPNGGATVYLNPSVSGNPYASIEDPDAIPVVDVHLPPYEEEES